LIRDPHLRLTYSHYKTILVSCCLGFRSLPRARSLTIRRGYETFLLQLSCNGQKKKRRRRTRKDTIEMSPRTRGPLFWRHSIAAIKKRGASRAGRGRGRRGWKALVLPRFPRPQSKLSSLLASQVCPRGAKEGLLRGALVGWPVNALSDANS